VFRGGIVWRRSLVPGAAGAMVLPIGLRADTRSGDVALVEVWVRVTLLAGAGARGGRGSLGEGERGEEEEDDAEDADYGLHCSEWYIV